MKKVLKDRNTLIGLLLALAGLFFLFPHFFIRPLAPLNNEAYHLAAVDLSWILTLNYASIHDYVWGKDFCYTYGPLGFLGLRNGWGVSWYVFLAYDIFYLFNFCALIFISYTRAVNKWIAALLIISVLLLVPSFPAAGSAVVVFLFLIFWICLSIKKQHPFYVVMQILLVSLLFYIKFNTGLISIVLFYMGLLYTGFFGKEKKVLLILYAVVPVVMILLLAIVLNVNLKGYIVSGAEMVSGYNAIMYFEMPGLQGMLWSALCIMALAAVYMLIRILQYRKQFIENAFVCAVIAIGFYILYKQAFIRMDIWHASEFFKSALLLLLCSGFFTLYKARKAINLILVVIVGISVAVDFKYSSYTLSGLEGKLDKSMYFNELFHYRSLKGGIQLYPSPNLFPETVRQKIGNSSVDIYPWNTYALIENKFNYVPRPVMQSYVPYTKYLENLNFEHYNSVKAPKYVIYDNWAIDGRYSLFDEPKMNLVLQRNYTIAERFEHKGRVLLLLEKKTGVSPVKLEFKREYAMYADSFIVPEKDVYYEISFYNTLTGKIRGILKYSPEMELIIKTRDYKEYNYKTSLPLLQSGLFSDYYVNTIDDFPAFLNQDTISNSQHVVYYGFKLKDPDLFKEKIRVKEYKITH